jgi:hypothetical protein
MRGLEASISLTPFNIVFSATRVGPYFDPSRQPIGHLDGLEHVMAGFIVERVA